MRISDWSSDVCSSELEGVAQGTGTSVVFEQSGGVFSVLPNDTLGKVLDASLRATGGVDYDADDTHFATALQQTLESPPPLAKAAEIGNYSSDGQSFASTDVGDVSWAVRSEEHTSELQSLMRISYA